MEKFIHTTHKLGFVLKARMQRGFSLVEVALAVAIFAFAFVGIFALLPAGLNQFHQALNTSVASQITQRILSEAQESDFDSLIAGGTGDANETILAKNALDPSSTVRWFDEQANELTSASGAIYHALTRVTPASALPKTGTSTLDNPHIATVTVQVANNPSGRALAFESGSASDDQKPLRNLWSGAFASNPSVKVVTVVTASTVVARK